MKLRDFAAQDERPIGTGNGDEHTFILTPITDIEQAEGEYGKYFVARVSYKTKEGWEEKKISIGIPLWITLRDKHDIGKREGSVQIVLHRDPKRPRDDQYIVVSSDHVA